MPIEVTAQISGAAVDDALLVLGNPEDPSVKVVSMFPRGAGKWQAVLPRVTESTSYCVTAERGRSESFSIEVMETPQIDSVMFTITPPDYTGLPSRKGRHPQDRIAGLSQTEIALEVTSNRPLAEGIVWIEAVGRQEDLAESVTLSVSSSDPHRVVGLVKLHHSGQWKVSVTGKNGVPTESPVILEADLLIDQPPIARIAQPQALSFATPDTRIPVAVVGEDDFGISRLRLYRILNGSRPIPLELPVETARRVIQGSSTLSLDQFGLQPGDKITLLARADDTRPDVEQGGESPLAEIEIISQRDFNRMIAARQGQQMLENKFRQARRMMDQLASELAELQDEISKADDNDPQVQQQLQERLNQLQQKMKDVADQLENLAQQELPLEIDEQWSNLLREQAESLRAAAAKCEAMNKEGKTAKQQSDELKKELDRIRVQQDQQIGQPLESLRKIAPLIASESRFAQLVARQRVVVDELDRFRKLESIHDEADRQAVVQLREEESAIRREMSELIDEIEIQAENLGEDPDFQELKESSLEFVAAVRESRIDSELSEARKSLGSFNGTEGYSHGLAALEEMEKFLSQCQANSAQAGQCLKKKFAPGMPKSASGNALSQMLAQMGLNPGPNSGYSMRGNSGQNVGLYGNQPYAQPTGSSRGQNGQMIPSHGERRVGAGTAESLGGNALALPEGTHSGTRDVPLRYRRQAETYLRRLAEQVER